MEDGEQGGRLTTAELLSQTEVMSTGDSVRLSFRVSRRERELLKSAAEAEKVSVSEFVRRSAIVEAELALLNRREVVVSAETWDAMMAWAAGPPRDAPKLRRLAETAPAWVD